MHPGRRLLLWLVAARAARCGRAGLSRAAPLDHAARTHSRSDRTRTARPHAPHIMPQNENEGAGVSRWLKRWWRALVAELVSTALLVLLGVATLVVGTAPLTHPALGFGFVVVLLAGAFGPTSGAHMNPAVTLAALIYGAIDWVLAIAYVVVQVLGGILGFGLLMVLSGKGGAGSHTGCTLPAVPAAAAAATEALLTGSLALLLCGLWAAHDDQRPDHAAPLKAGLAIAGLVYAGGPLTGASLNPARSFGPALLNGHWDHHWVYWVGPLSGGALAALLHRFVLRAPAPRATPRDEALPLHDKA